jgi:fructose-specific phosphotransferase system IIA component
MLDEIYIEEERMTEAIEVCSFLKPERVLVLKEGQKHQVLNELTDLIAQDPKIRDAEAMKKAIFDREKTMSTSIGDGVAIPHARTAAADDFVVAFAKIQNGVDFDAIDGKPVQLIFMIVANEHQDKKYIKVLSRLMLRMKKNQLIERLMACDNAEELFRVLVESK